MKRTFLTASFFLCCLAIPTFSGSFTGSGTIDPFELSGQVCPGVNIHFVKGHEKDLDMIAAAGFKFIRMDFGWQSTEHTKGTYDWSGYDELTANLEKRGLSAIYILDYSNSLYEETVESVNPLDGKVQKNIASPQHEESIIAFARWAAEAAGHFRGHNIIWEIWNEPNIFFWKPKPLVTQYNALALASAKAIKEKVPGARIIGPASSEVPLTFLESFISSGILEYLDAVSVHPYRNYSKSPESASSDYSDLRKLIARYAPENKKNMPVISSEWGYSTFTKGISDEIQAQYIVRMQLSNCLNQIPLSIWYDWMDDGKDPDEREHNFGTVTHELIPKPSYNSVKIMNTQLEGYTLLRRFGLENDKDYILVFRNEKNQFKLVAWTSGTPHEVTIDNDISTFDSIKAMDGMGNTIKPETANQKLILELRGLPQYITLPSGI